MPKKDGIIEYESAELYLYDYVDNYFDNNLIAKTRRKKNSEEAYIKDS